MASLLGFYLLIVQLFEALDFPFHLPVGDLGTLWETCKKKSVFFPKSRSPRLDPILIAFKGQ